jgi:hypothetical protein
VERGGRFRLPGPAEPRSGSLHHVSKRNKDFDAGRAELTHPIGKENPCPVVTPLAIEHIATDHEKTAFLVDCGLDQIINSPA